ncbi:unnamed protein product [Thelazia callipaeda]|uniref:Secreted protein n=1 Tax=Thelazia callipaeda TaxID=103827 RepID=A0A0N5D073_THECL|nr:unnamed protein product [Thelazia callipaeda]
MKASGLGDGAAMAAVVAAVAAAKKKAPARKKEEKGGACTLQHNSMATCRCSSIFGMNYKQQLLLHCTPL